MALIILSIISVLALGVMSSTQSEIWSTANYRNATQARFVAEAGMQQAARYLSTTPLVASALGSLISQLNTTTIPITYNNYPVFIQSSTTNPVPTVTNGAATSPSTTSTFPSAALVADFQSTVGGASSTPYTFTGGSNSLGQYSVAVQLIGIQPATTGWQTKWKIVSVGSVSGVKSAKVQLVAMVEGTFALMNTTKPTFNYGLYALGTGCNVISMSGGQDTESFDSSTGTTTNTHHGDIAANGSINLSSYTIDGAVYSSLSAGITSLVQPYAINVSPWVGPYIGGGYSSSTCAADVNNSALHFAVYEDNSGYAVVTNNTGNPRLNSSLAGCYQAMTCPTGYNTFNYESTLPSVANPVTTTVAATGSGCTSDPGCNGSANWNATSSSSWISGSTADTKVNGTVNFGLSPSATTSYGAVTVGSAGVIMHLSPGTYNFDSLNITGSGQVVVDTPSSCSGTSCQVTINIVGSQTTGSTPININGAGIANNSGNPANLLINYNGTGNVDITAAGSVWATIDAPNAAFYDTGGAKIYGAVISSTAQLTGSGQIIYDTNLRTSGTTGSTTYTANPLFVSAVSWSSY
jgi:Tfp pilus assembly protein PilX